MSNQANTSKEGTPFVIDFKQRNQGSYGAADTNGTTNKDGQLNFRASERNSADLTDAQNNNNDINADEPTLGTRSGSTLYCLHGHSSVDLRDHCHQQRKDGVDVKARKKLVVASILCLVFMIAEIIGGVLSNSLAIATDAAHLLTDFASFMISLFAIWIAGRPSTQKMNFGWYRAEVIGALASVVMIWFITAILVYLAIQRLITKDFEVDAKIMLITSGLAILVNFIMGFQLQHGHSHGGMVGHSHAPKTKKVKKHTKSNQNQLRFKSENPSLIIPSTSEERTENVLVAADSTNIVSYQNSTTLNENNIGAITDSAQTVSTVSHKDAVNMNVRAAFIHVLGDMVQSLGVFIAALVIYFRPDWAIADPICTFIFSIIVLITTFTIMKDTLLVLMEGTPNYMQYNEVFGVLERIEGVERVHNLRIWALSINKIALSVHLAIDPGANPKKILADATAVVHKRYNFFETTIQIEEVTPQMDNCQQCVVPNH